MFEETHCPSTLYIVLDNVFPQTGGSGWTRSREFWMAHFLGAPKSIGLENWSYVMLK